MKAEKTCYWVVWIMSILYALYKFRKSTELHYLISAEDFEEGWISLKPRQKDNSDLEWVIFTSTFKKFWIIFAAQVICSRCCKKGALPYFYTIYSSICLVVVVGLHMSVVFVSYPCTMFMVHQTGRKSLCYLLSVMSLFALHHPTFTGWKDTWFPGEADSFLFDVGFGWMVAKSLSFSVDRIEAGLHRCTRDWSYVLAYCLYLPVVFTGPVLTYNAFRSQLVAAHRPSPSLGTVLRVPYQLLQYMLYECLLHHLYSSAVQFLPSSVSGLDGWSLCGLGYALPLMFYLKYHVIYGMAGAVAALEGFRLPPPPRCISAVHRSSFLWRHFDRGLYLWILRYLYLPLVDGRRTFLRRAFSLCACFSFVALWHGLDGAVCVWSALNCALVLSEGGVAILGAGRWWQSLSLPWRRRVEALLCTPHFVAMCISCCFFLSNWEIGELLCRRVVFGGIFPLLPLCLVMYCGCHVAMDAKRWRMER